MDEYYEVASCIFSSKASFTPYGGFKVLKSSLVTPFLIPLRMPSTPCVFLLQCSSFSKLGPSFVSKTNVSNLGSVGGNCPPRTPMGPEPLFGSAGGGGCAKSRSWRHTHANTQRFYPAAGRTDA